MKKINFHSLSAAHVVRKLKTNVQTGLSEEEALKRLKQYGANRIEAEKSVGILELFLDQLTDPLVMLLLGTVGVAAVVGQTFEAILITAIVVFMAIVGVVIEKQAGDALAKLKKLTVFYAQVVRNGRVKRVRNEQVVPGDVIRLYDGDRIPADCRVVKVNDLKVDEAVLTGESVPVSKRPHKVGAKVTIADRKSMLFTGTYVTQGNCLAVVVATGMKTELGKIAAELLEKESRETPLQAQLKRLSKALLWTTLIISGVISLVGWLRGQNVIDSLIQAMSLAIAFIPEGLSAVMTVVLAMAVREMVQKQVIIKRLIAAEGLGSISILATDKTGTITQGKMAVEKLWFYKREVDKRRFRPTKSVEQKMVDVLRFCNNGKGATEGALIEFLSSLGLVFDIDRREKEHRFSSLHKRMMVVRKEDNNLIGYAKGAADVLLPRCRYYFDNKTDRLVKLTEKQRRTINQQTSKYAAQGYRVLALAYRRFYRDYRLGERDNDESRLAFVGLVCLSDPLRKEVRETVVRLRKAGVRPIMITGDHKNIARTIAYEARIVNRKDAKVLEGVDLESHFSGKKKISDKELLRVRIFARVDPEHKNQLIDLFKNNGLTAAMVGDGVNDALALSRADIGIAAKGATDIAKEAADVVVTGGYGALANAVEMGRVVVERTRLYLHYILSGNICEIGVFVLAILFNQPMPLTAVTLLLINVLTDAAPAMAMAFEKGEAELMTQRPRSTKEGIMTKNIWQSVVVHGLISSLFLYLVFVKTLPFGLVYAQTATFTAYIFQKILRAFTARSLTRSVMEYGWFSNKFMLVAVGISLGVWGLVVMYMPSYFRMVRLGVDMLSTLLTGALVFPLIEEGLKWYRRNGSEEKGILPH